MSLLGKGVLAIWNGIEREAESEFLKWHVHEHIPERVALPGFLRGRRYVALDGDPKFFNFYETCRVSDLMSQAYLAELDRPSEWTKSVVRSFRNTSRTICAVSMTLGHGEGAFVETLRLETARDPSAFRRALADAVLLPASREAGIVGVHLLEGQSGQNTGETAESRLRGGQDEAAAWVILIESVHRDAFETLRRSLLQDNRLSAAGAQLPVKRGLYALQFALAKAELGSPVDQPSPEASVDA